MPSDRLLRFRQYMAAFEGSADPAKSIDHGHYVHAPGQLLVDQIAGRIALRPTSTYLLVGGIGSGKTTQLLVAKQQLEEVEDLAVCYVDVSRYTDISQIEPGVLMAIVGLEVLNHLPQELYGSVSDAAEALRKSGYGYTETEKISINQSKMFGIESSGESRSERIQHKGLFTQTENERLRHSVQEILDALIHHTGRSVIFFCDGLDLLEDVDRFAKMIRSDIQSLKQTGIGLLVVGPILFTHSEDQDGDCKIFCVRG
jgi:Cdc6-like AAA superfamily ATPase